MFQGAHKINNLCKNCSPVYKLTKDLTFVGGNWGFRLVCSTSLASAHARLSLRLQVTEDDAVMAIYLYEESVTCRYGQYIARNEEHR